MDRDEHEHYQKRINDLENRNKHLIEQLMKYDIVTTRVIEMKCDKSLIEESIIKENTQLKTDLHALRKAIENLIDKEIGYDEEKYSDIMYLLSENKVRVSNPYDDY